MHLLNTSIKRNTRPFVKILEDSGEIKSQVAILRSIKNEIAGHELRKIEYICDGLIPCIIEKLLQIQDETADELWIQSSQILCIIANAGPQFTEPILYSNAISFLLKKLPQTRTRISLSILRCLNAIADNLPLESRNDWVADPRLAEQLYTSENATYFSKIISNAGKQLVDQQVCDAILALICKTCQEKYKAILVETGFLTALYQRLSTFIVAEGFVLQHDNQSLPEPAPKTAHLSPVLEIISCLIENSKSNAEQLLQDPSLSTVFNTSISSPQRKPWRNQDNPIDALLPFAPDNNFITEAEQSSFPPLGSNLPKRRTSSRAITEFSLNSNIEKNESPLIPWLLYLVRAYQKKRRFVAAKLLVILQKHGLLQLQRKRSFASLLIPILVQMLDKDDECLSNQMYIHQATPNLLALAVMDDEILQKSAVDSKAIPKLVSALKSNFESFEIPESLWWPQKDKPTMTTNQQSSLGFGGPNLKSRNEMILREGLLQALASIAPTNDKYRKDICEEGALNQIMLALEPFQGLITASQNGDWIEMSGNSSSTLLAACGTVRALTRSVTSLRTKLVDADVGKAVLKLMNAQDPEVRIAATKVVCNLLLDFSPIKQTISESSLVKKLCEQAHSANARLRFESLWALKSMVYKSTNKLKKEVVDELGSSWIRHLLSTDPQDIPPGEVIGLVEKEYPKGLGRSDDDVVMTDDDFSRHTLTDDIEIQEQLLGFLSNLFCGEQCSEIVEYVLEEIGSEDFMFIMLERLRSKVHSGSTRRGNQTSTAPIGIILTTILVITHVAAAGDKFKSMVISNSLLLKQLATFCGHPDSSIRTACCWLAINLMYKEKDGDSDGVLRQRALELQKAGFHTHIRRLETTDSDMDVKERAKSAMLLFNIYLKN